MTISLDIPTFRGLFPALVASNDSVVTLQWDSATLYISAEDYGYLAGVRRNRALHLMTAHLIALSNQINAGNSTGLVSASTIDKVSVTVEPPPVLSQFNWWLSLTPYGQQLIALLSASKFGGITIGGRPERSAFRKVGGTF